MMENTIKRKRLIVGRKIELLFNARELKHHILLTLFSATGLTILNLIARNIVGEDIFIRDEDSALLKMMMNTATFFLFTSMIAMFIVMTPVEVKIYDENE